MNDIDYKKLYNRTGKDIGWDFSSLKVSREGIKWNFYEEVVKKAKPTDKLLDIGTGGGKKVFEIADEVKSIVGIDNSSSMIQKANKNLKESGLKKIRFLKMDAFRLDFPDNSFDLVTCRHSPFSSKEVYRVLKKKGYFMTQQVGESDKLNIKKAFGRGQSWDKKDGSLMKKYISELKESGFKIIRKDEYNSTEYYKTPEDLIFLLKHTPIIPDFGKDKKDFEILDRFIEKNKTPKGIKTNSKRFIIIVQA